MSHPRDLLRSLLADLEQIEDNAQLYRSGRESAYQTVAIQLRNLLLSGQRALLGRVVPHPMLHQLRPSNLSTEGLDAIHSEPSKIMMMMDVRGRVRMSTVPPGAQVQLEFTNDLLEVEKWLDQWVIRPDVKLRSLIIKVANEEVAHTQDEIGATIVRAQDFIFSGVARERILRNAVIVSVGEYVANRTREMLRDLTSSTSPTA